MSEEELIAELRKEPPGDLAGYGWVQRYVTNGHRAANALSHSQSRVEEPPPPTEGLQGGVMPGLCTHPRLRASFQMWSDNETADLTASCPDCGMHWTAEAVPPERDSKGEQG